MKKYVLLLLGMVLAPVVGAMTFMEREYICPIDGAVFSVQIQSSGFSSGAYFDLQQVGAIMSPSPLPQCPGNGFVVDEERRYDPEQLQRLKAWVASPEYRRLVQRDTSYYRLAQQERFLGKSRADVAVILLSATWQAGAERYARYASEAIDAMRERAQRDAGKPERFHSLLLVGELQRRLGRFEDAQNTFDAIAADPGFPGQGNEQTNDHMSRILKAQLELVKARDTRHVGFDSAGNISVHPG